jgi:hypothetical protein
MLDRHRMELERVLMPAEHGGRKQNGDIISLDSSNSYLTAEKKYNNEKHQAPAVSVGSCKRL